MDPKQEDLVISEFLQSMGPWREVIVIGGGYALIIYKLYLVLCSQSFYYLGCVKAPGLNDRKGVHI